MKQTKLYEEHLSAGARMVDFASYLMPVQYSGVIAEHQAVRERVGIFDVSHMGWLTIAGPDVANKVNPLFTKDLAKLNNGSALYSLMCNKEGGTIDDLILYKENEDTLHMVLNASNKAKDLNHIQRYLETESSLKIKPQFDEVSIIAVQGPRSLDLLKELGCPLDYKFMTFGKWQILNHATHLAFTGYTGEVGAEWIIPNAIAKEIWSKLLEVGKSYGISPCGLAARDTLRTEMGYSLYGHELTEEISPLSAGLNWAISWDKPDFVGKAALLLEKSEPTKKLVALKSDTKRAARPGAKVVDSLGQEVGSVTSGTFSPTLGYSIAMAIVPKSSDGPYYVPFREDKLLFEITRRPFYTKTNKH
jgi:aminomethyltransferase